MLTHKHISVSLAILLVLASLMFISPVNATTFQAPPYDDKWTLVSGSNYPDADANLTTGHLVVWALPLTNEEASAQVKTWKRVWLPAGDSIISYSWKIKGALMCGLYGSFTGVHLSLFVEKSLNEGTINETTLFHRYADLENLCGRIHEGG